MAGAGVNIDSATPRRRASTWEGTMGLATGVHHLAISTGDMKG
jgi:hypothetical protein